MDFMIRPSLLIKFALSNFIILFSISNLIICNQIGNNKENAIKTARHEKKIDYKILDENFDAALLEVIAGKNEVESKVKTVDKVKSLLSSDDKILIEESIRLILIERLKSMYVKTSRSR